MHCILAYDLTAEGERKTEIENKIESFISPYKHVKRLSGYYIIQLRASIDWNTILLAITELSENIPERFYFILSPIMNEGRYNGILPKGEWDDINAISHS